MHITLREDREAYRLALSAVRLKLLMETAALARLPRVPPLKLR